MFFDRRRCRFRSYRLPQGGGASHQVRLRGLLRQAFQSRFDLRCKLGHLGIFSRTRNLAAGHRTGIINGNIIEQPPNGLNLGFARAGRLEGDQGQEQNSQSAAPQRPHRRE
ncbi:MULTISPECIES: hypothetical protein [unclassified Sphingopyxis]|uniref:hypothetical protein n=1 Tax=unclassified Sphingopyxis TaxID=2614943 RepID=UPI0032C23373